MEPRNSDGKGVLDFPRDYFSSHSSLQTMLSSHSLCGERETAPCLERLNRGNGRPSQFSPEWFRL